MHSLWHVSLVFFLKTITLPDFEVWSTAHEQSHGNTPWCSWIYSWDAVPVLTMLNQCCFMITARYVMKFGFHTTLNSSRWALPYCIWMIGNLHWWGMRWIMDELYILFLISQCMQITSYPISSVNIESIGKSIVISEAKR